MLHLLTSNTKITNLDDACIQPDAVDLRVGKIYRIDPTSIATLTEHSKTHAVRVEVFPNEDGMYVLQRGAYVVEFDHRIEVGADECGWVVSRSTLMRNGVYLHSCLYDSGYVGPMVSGLNVVGVDTFLLEVNARIGQYVCTKVDGVQHQYNGSYQEKKPA